LNKKLIGPFVEDEDKKQMTWSWIVDGKRTTRNGRHAGEGERENIKHKLFWT